MNEEPRGATVSRSDSRARVSAGRPMMRRLRPVLFAVVVLGGAAAAQDPGDAALDAARESFRSGEYEKALEQARAALGADAGNPTARYIEGTALLRLSRYDEADPVLAALDEEHPKFPGLQFQIGYLAFARAEGLADQPGQGERARELYSKAADRFAKELERNPDQVAVLSSHAIALGKAGRLDEAIGVHEKWIAAEPESNNPLLSLGAFLSEAGRSQEAAAVLDRLPASDPSVVAAAALAYGTKLYEDGRFREAVPFLSKALSHDPGSSRAQGLLVACYARLGDLDRTATELTAYLALGPTEDEAAQVGEVIRQAFVENPPTPPAGVTAPTVRKMGPVRFPKDARDSKISTEVLVIVRVRPDGTPGSMDIVPNRIYREMREQGFEAAALEAVRRSKFLPGEKAGQPIDMPLLVPVRFDP